MIKFQIQKLKYFGLASSRMWAKVSCLTCQVFNYRSENEIALNSLLTNQLQLQYILAPPNLAHSFKRTFLGLVGSVSTWVRRGQSLLSD